MDLNTTFANVQAASRQLLAIDDQKINEVLRAVADAAIENTDFILSENRKDLDRMDPANPKYDRLKLTAERLQGIASDTRNVALLPSPLGRVLKETVRPNGLKIKRVSVPFGVIGIIYEARPNVSFDVFSLCLKSGNACILKGGSDADCSNRAIVSVIHRVLERFGIDPHIVELLPADHEATAQLLHANGYVDLIIPRGSSRLINFVRQNATIPVIETGAGICHTYFDRYGDLKKGTAIVNNAKTRRVSVCNALDCLLVDNARLADLPALCAPLQESNVILYADALAYDALQGYYPADLLQHSTPESYGTEFLDYKLAIKTVDGLDGALEHIRLNSSKHSECIVTEDKERANCFCRVVDAACVYVNAPTSFTDGAQFGLGAEIGISTQKLHARGPMGLEEITTYKWIVEGEGQVRPK
ncbi:glutamate-5-semialdehyde dehydrogenase [uncultured Bacteroides sp.]|uniref:glutamate-5-semialdehyde dehydrogenase n=1 Tax=uncultured Bacteroides sp. TaxID=162156 RepID=UPI00260588AC|nr:glutamate-5-semialdehyde dehydrogenase [uncultured Bacteroides sp.]